MLIIDYASYNEFITHWNANKHVSRIDNECLWINTCIKSRGQLKGYKAHKMTEQEFEECFQIYKNEVTERVKKGVIMINDIKARATSEQLEVIEQHKENEDKALSELNKWARTQITGDAGAIDGEKVIAKFVELIQSDLSKVKEPKKVKPPKPKKEVKIEPKPPKKKVAKKFKQENQVGFGFDLDVQEVEQKPIWEL